jgi:hypothetical protein
MHNVTIATLFLIIQAGQVDDQFLIFANTKG